MAHPDPHGTVLNTTAFDAMLKQIYPAIRVQQLALKKRPLLEWLSKSDDFYGNAVKVPVLYEDPQSVGADLKVVIDNSETSKQEAFLLTARKKGYGAVQMEAEAIMAASKDMGSFIRSKDLQIQGMLRSLGKQLHLAAYRSGTGAIGEIAAEAVTLITLTRKSDVHNFGVGQTLVASTADGGGSLRDSGQTYKVVKRSVSAGTLTLNADANDASGWDVGDFLFAASNYDAMITGLAAWLPLTEAGLSGAFFGVDRTKDATRLGGHRVDNPGRSIIENGEELAMLIGEEGGEPDAWFLNPRAGAQLAAQLGAQVTRTDGGKGKFGFTGFTLVHFTTGPIDVVFDYACPPNRGYMLQKNTWKVHHMGGFPHIVRDDGLSSLRGARFDGIEVRGRYFGEMACRAPAFNGVMSVATA